MDSSISYFKIIDDDNGLGTFIPLDDVVRNNFYNSPILDDLKNIVSNAQANFREISSGLELHVVLGGFEDCGIDVKITSAISKFVLQNALLYIPRDAKNSYVGVYVMGSFSSDSINVFLERVKDAFLTPYISDKD